MKDDRMAVSPKTAKKGTFGKTFFPTPAKLADRMIGLIGKYPKNHPVRKPAPDDDDEDYPRPRIGHPGRVLEPSAGRGDLIERLIHRYKYDRHWAVPNIFAIEIDEELQAALRGKDIKVIDSDFLEFSGPDKFDLIIANPPFDEGDRHLLKAIEIMYCGQIIFLLNAETLRNPHTNIRQALVKKLDALKADVEYISGAFRDAERSTGVEVALQYCDRAPDRR